MSKGLKALNELKQSCETHMGTMVYILQEDKFKTIEQELKDYEQLKEMYNHALKVHSKLSESIVKYKKELKALEIIKVKQVNVYSFIQRKPKTFEEYQDIDDEIEQLSEASLSGEEYDLLKEIML